MSDWQRLQKEAQRLLKKGSSTEALASYRQLLAHVDAPPADYDAWVAEAERAASHLTPPRPAAYLALYRRDFAAALTLLPAADFAAERAQVLRLAGLEALAAVGKPRAAVGAAGGATGQKQLGEAAGLFEQAGQPLFAAVAYAQAGDKAAAVRCYRLLLGNGQLPVYEQALCHFQLAKLLAGAPKAERDSQRQAVLAQQLLESLADEREAAGDVDRALDCYLIYSELGRVHGRGENTIEGALGCLRLLRAERRTLDAVQACNALLADCQQLGEDYLAAAQGLEAADELEGQGDPTLAALAPAYRRAAATALLRVAARYRPQGDSAGRPQLAESAYLQAIAAYNAIDDFAAITATWQQLATLPLAAGQRQRYQQLADSYAHSTAQSPAPPSPPPDPLPVASGSPLPVWDLDLTEWQAGGSPLTVCLALVGDRSRPLLTRRHALTVLLALAEPTAPSALAGDDGQSELGRRLVAGLSGLRCYEALRPLELLYRQASPAGVERAGGSLRAIGAARHDPAARAAVANPSPAARLRREIVEALPRLPFRRAVALLIRSLADPDLWVYTASLLSLSRAHFPEAVSALCSLYRATTELEVRQAVLTALMQSRDPRALSHLREVARHAAEPLRSDAQRLLQQLAAAGT